MRRLFSKKVIPKPTLFTLEGLKCKAEFVSNYDGDSFRLIIPFCCKEFIFKCRLNGLDTPEIRGKSDLEKEVAKKVRTFVHDRCFGKDLWITCGEFDKYGRVLCDIFFSEQDLKERKNSLTEVLVDKGYAYKYDGGTKLLFEEWYLTTTE